MKIDKAELDAQLAENPTQAVAMVSVRAIDELSQMMIKAGIHDAASVSMVMGLCAWLTSVLDGKATDPGQALVDAAKTIDEAVLQELDRCQHFVQELHDRVKLAESRALVSEQYAGWYLRLRDGKSGNIRTGIVEWGDVEPEGEGDCPIEFYEPVEGEELDAAMEDLDNPTAAMPPPSEFA